MKRALILFLICAAGLRASTLLKLNSGAVLLSDQKAVFPAKGGRALAVAAAIPGVDGRFFAGRSLYVLAYLPERAYLLWLDAREWHALEGASEIRALIPLKSEWKRGPEAADGLYRALVLRPSPEPRLRSIRVRLRPNEVEAFLGRPDVVWLEPAGTITVRNDTTSWVLQSNQQDLRPIYDQGLHGENEIVGHIDNPMWPNSCYFYDPNHPIGPDHRKIVAYRSSTGIGKDAHGTHTAGTVCGEADGQPDNGIAYNARLSFSSLADVTGYGNTTSNLYDTLVAAHQDGAHIHTNSWGDDTTIAYTTWCYDIDRYSYDYPDDLVFFAISNMQQLKTPENAKNVMAVGATKQAPNQDARCYGGLGPTSDGRLKPDLYAPGCGILSASSTEACGTLSLSGTSMASPAVAAAGVLIRQYFREGFYPSGAPVAEDGFLPSGSLIKAMLINAGQDLTAEPGYPSYAEGWGRPELDQVLHFSGGARNLWVQDVDRSDGLGTGDVRAFRFNVQSAGEPLKITMVFDDFPALPNAATAPVNDLDLEVTAPDGTVYLGNVMTNGISQSGGGADAIDTVEEVILPTPQAGAYAVRVRGTNVPVPPQGFALAATGDLAGTLRYYLPAVARAPGYGGSLWKTDLWIFNPEADSQNVILTYIPSGNPTQPQSVTLALAGLEARYLADPLKDLFGLDQGFGAALLESSDTLSAAVRIVNAASGATYGQGYTALSESLRDGQESYLPGLFLGSARRTNIGLVNYGSDAASVTLTLHDADGNSFGSVPLSLEAFSHHQWSLSELFPSVAALQAGAMTVGVDSGSGVAAYASVITSETGDGIFLAPQAVPAGDALIPVLASAVNPTGYPWRTEMSLFAPQGGAFNGSFRVNNGSGWTVLPMNFTPAENGSAYLDDVLSSVGLASGVGYLTFSGPFIPSVRVWSGTDADHSMGQSIPMMLQTHAALHHWLPGDLPGADYRLNLGIENLGGTDLLCQAALWNASHTLISGTVVGCPAQSLVQQNAGLLFGPLPQGEGGVIELSCSGPVFAYVSLVDSVTSDATLFMP